MNEYIEMRKFYYSANGNRSNVEAELNSRLSSVSTHRFDFKIGQNNAFVMLNPELLLKLSSIYNLKTDIAMIAVHLPPVAHQQCLRKYMADEIYQTNEVENVHSTHKEIRESIADVERGSHGKRFDGMVRKYLLLIHEESIALNTCEDIRNLYNDFVLDEVMKDNADDQPDGTLFRKDPVAVLGKGGRTIHTGLFPETAIISAMEKALAALNDSAIDILIRIAAFHYMFAYIHPFYDGNGRMTRFISCAKLVEHISIFASFRLSYVIKENRAKYYRMFKEANDKHNYGDLTRFVIDFLSFIEDAMDDVKANLQGAKNRLDNCTEILDKLVRENRLSKNDNTVLFVLVQERLFCAEGMSMDELIAACKLSQRTIKTILDKNADIIIKRRDGRRLLYSLDIENLQVMD